MPSHRVENGLWTAMGLLGMVTPAQAPCISGAHPWTIDQCRLFSTDQKSRSDWSLKSDPKNQGATLGPPWNPWGLSSFKCRFTIFMGIVCTCKIRILKSWDPWDHWCRRNYKYFFLLLLYTSIDCAFIVFSMLPSVRLGRLGLSLLMFFSWPLQQPTSAIFNRACCKTMGKSCGKSSRLYI